jgi:4-hydroxyproline epimerase
MIERSEGLRLAVIDSHTEGEPTRTILSGAPDLGGGSMNLRLERLRTHHDDLRRLCVLEPRGFEAIVGALITEPIEVNSSFGVIFFNNSGYLGMCGHATIGALASLQHVGHIRAGAHRIDTPVGTVDAVLHPDGQVRLTNVASYRQQVGVVLQLDSDILGIREVRGDIAWGGNWFFIIRPSPITVELANQRELTTLAWGVRRALQAAGIRASHNGSVADIDHISLVSRVEGADARSFVLCPGGAVDRSPCGTGTSALLACLAADQQLAPEQPWRQEGILGSFFDASYRHSAAQKIIPTLLGRAWVTAEATLLVDPSDPFPQGYQLSS